MGLFSLIHSKDVESLKENKFLISNNKQQSSGNLVIREKNFSWLLKSTSVGFRLTFNPVSQASNG